MKTYRRATAADFKNIPAELKEFAQWECWKILTGEKGKQRKVPVDPLTGRTYPKGLLNSEDMGNATYEQARRCFARDPSLCGIGFRLKKSDPFSGVDMDDCCNPAEHTMQSWASDLVAEFHTYSEYSPSGTGIKLIAKGKIPAAVTKTNNVEMYSDGRFFALTGRVVNGVTVIRPAQRELDRLYNVITAQKKPYADSPAPSSANSTPGAKWKPGGEHYAKLLSVIGSLHRHDPGMSEAQGVNAALAFDRERAEQPYPEEKIRGMVGDIWKKIDTPARAAVETADDANADDWPDPSLLGDELPPVQSFVPELLPRSFLPLVEDISERMQVPMDYAAASCIVALAGCLNRRAAIQPKAEDTSWRVIPNLWGAVVAHRQARSARRSRGPQDCPRDAPGS
jgi:hypothetical protein